MKSAVLKFNLLIFQILERFLGSFYQSTRWAMIRIGDTSRGLDISLHLPVFLIVICTILFQ